MPAVERYDVELIFRFKGLTDNIRSCGGPREALDGALARLEGKTVDQLEAALTDVRLDKA